MRRWWPRDGLATTAVPWPLLDFARSERRREMNALTLPTRKAEEWRYSDLDALAAIWPTPAPTRIDVAAGENARHHLLQDAADGAAAVHDYAITVADGEIGRAHVWTPVTNAQ